MMCKIALCFIPKVRLVELGLTMHMALGAWIAK